MLAAIMDLLITSFDNQMLPKTLNFLQNFPESALARLSSESSAQAIWLRLMLSDELENIDLANLKLYPEHLGFPLKQRIGKFSAKDIGRILTDPDNSMFPESMKIAFKYLENCDQAPIEALLAIVKKPLDADLMDRLCNVIAKFQCMRVLSDRIRQDGQTFVDFTELETWCEVLLRLNPLEAVGILSGLLAHSDQFWVQVSEWLAKHQSVLNFLRPDLIERIKSLDSLPSSFIISYTPISHRLYQPFRLSLFNASPVKIPSADLELCISPRQIVSYHNAKCLLLSLLTTALGTSRVGKVARTHIIVTLPTLLFLILIVVCIVFIYCCFDDFF